MGEKFFIQKIEQLPDDKLKELLRLRNDKNSELLVHAEHEAIRRGIDPATIEVDKNKFASINGKPKDDQDSDWILILLEFFLEI